MVKLSPSGLPFLFALWAVRVGLDLNVAADHDNNPALQQHLSASVALEWDTDFH